MSIMRWLTRECLTGGLDTEEEWQRRYDDYDRNVALVSGMAANGVEELIPERLNLHDGQPNSWGLDGQEFWWRVLVGDLQRGYEWATITYFGAELFPEATEEALDAWPLSDLEIGADELEVLSDGRIEQRFLLWPDGEFGVRFDACKVECSPAAASDRISGAI